MKFPILSAFFNMYWNLSASEVYREQLSCIRRHSVLILPPFVPALSPLFLRSGLLIVWIRTLQGNFVTGCGRWRLLRTKTHVIPWPT